jgi:NitT/TauT family transport system substrate-binding protein
MVILAKTKVKDAVGQYPALKDVLISLSPRFQLWDNKAVFDMVSRWATFGDVARMGELSICEVLHKLNMAIGSEEELLARAPDCLKERTAQRVFSEKTPAWMQNAVREIVLDVRKRDDFFLPEVLEAVQMLEEGQTLKIINGFYPAPLIEMLLEEGREIFYESPSFYEHVVYVRGEKRKTTPARESQKERFPLLDSEAWGKDFLSSLVREAESCAPGTGFRLLLKTPSDAIVNTVETLGFESLVEKTKDGAYLLAFYKPKIEGAPALIHKVPLVIQSATPVVYPILMRLLESKRLMREIRVDELKVWDKTEKHLGWIVNKKADISFSAVAAVAKLYQKDLDIKMPVIAVWDNFFILTRGAEVKNFGDLKGRDIYLPLIPAAPPYAVTTFLMTQLGYDPDDFHFVFGKPFGRPEDIKTKLLSGEAEAGLLREPEASFAIHEGRGLIRESIAYRDLWETLFPGQGNLPNAGLLFKGEILRNYPDLAEMFMEETKNATRWVNENPQESARMIAEMMHVSPDAAELFLSRAHLESIPSTDVLEQVMHYIDVLNKAGYGGKPFGEIRSLFE